jgi:hypothetical protein
MPVRITGAAALVATVPAGAAAEALPCDDLARRLHGQSTSELRALWRQIGVSSRLFADASLDTRQNRQGVLVRIDPLIAGSRGAGEYARRSDRREQACGRCGHQKADVHTFHRPDGDRKKLSGSPNLRPSSGE